MAVVWPSKNNFANGDVLTAANMNNIADTLNVFNPTSATNGQILTADGSGGVSYQTLVSGGYTQISTGTITVAAVNTDISSIPAGYKAIEVWFYNFLMAANQAVNVSMWTGAAGAAGEFADQYYGGDSTTAKLGGNQGTSGAFCVLRGSTSLLSTSSRNFIRAQFWNYASTTIEHKHGVGWFVGRSSTGYTGNSSVSVSVDTTAAAFNTIRLGGAGGSNINSGNYIIWGIN